MYFKERFKEKIALVTGAAVGIGKAVAHRLGKEGATVLLFDYNNAKLEETAKEFQEAGILV
ncbi:SDR family NAD(P)-dependent oxidoreductase, partial [Mariniphaga sediminis]|uniref:SDR family NAD(P)-dependent oxidoreductase n=1 Tax=Mariniphaga sediminis TaxID=1628158 RepID=UPI003566F8A0